MQGEGTPQTVFITLGTHCDLFWMGTDVECLERGTQVQRHALDLLEQHADYCYYLETTVFAEYHLRRFPEDKARIWHDDCLRDDDLVVDNDAGQARITRGSTARTAATWSTTREHVGSASWYPERPRRGRWI